MEIVIEGTPECIAKCFKKLTNETPGKQNLVINGEEVSTTDNNEESCNLKVTNLDELKNLNDQLIELYTKFINFKFKTEIVENEQDKSMWEKVEKQLKIQGISQYELSKRMGVTSSTITELKKGRINKPSFELMCKIADALDVELEVFR